MLQMKMRGGRSGEIRCRTLTYERQPVPPTPPTWTPGRKPPTPNTPTPNYVPGNNTVNSIAIILGIVAAIAGIAEGNR